MTSKRSMVLFGLLCFVALSNLRFNCTKGCANALCDLTTEIAIAVASAQTGAPINVPNLIRNTADAAAECLTEPAGESQSRIKIDYDVDDNGTFGQNQLNTNFYVPGINPDQTITENYEFVFNEPGDYRLITFCDDKLQVVERNENNNGSAPDIFNAGRSQQAAKQALIITVLPTPGFVKDPNAPNVQLLRRTLSF